MWNLSLQEHVWARGKALTRSLSCCCCCLCSCKYTPGESGWQEKSWGDACGFVELLLTHSTWGPQALAQRKAEAGAQSLAKVCHAGLCLWPGEIITLAVNLGGPVQIWVRTPQEFNLSLLHTGRKTNSCSQMVYKSMTGGSRGEPFFPLALQSGNNEISGVCSWLCRKLPLSLEQSSRFHCMLQRLYPAKIPMGFPSNSGSPLEQ